MDRIGNITGKSSESTLNKANLSYLERKFGQVQSLYKIVKIMMNLEEKLTSCIQSVNGRKNNSARLIDDEAVHVEFHKCMPTTVTIFLLG